MALLSILKLPKHTQLAIWKIEEDEDSLLRQYPDLISLLPSLDLIASSARRLEKLVSHQLLYLLLKSRKVKINHLSSGKPFIPNYYISISHTKGYVALIVSKDCPVGLDIEYVSDRVKRVKERFMRKDEFANSLSELLIIWSAKETMYKFYSEDTLSFFEMRSITFSADQAGTLFLENIKRNEKKKIFYELNSDFVLTYII